MIKKIILSRSEIPPVNYAEIQGAIFRRKITGKYGEKNGKYGNLEEIGISKWGFHTNFMELYKMFVNSHRIKRIFTFPIQISMEIFT